MSEFEKEVLSALKDLKAEINNLRTEMNENFAEVREELEITRVAANYNGEKLEELSEELKKLNVIS